MIYFFVPVKVFYYFRAKFYNKIFANVSTIRPHIANRKPRP